ncbi:MAG TPA: aromatic acid exporter family protein [Nocardioidaceae bacterium]|nr:aromatic acid exporter family protein [Nocardioidaceae bacterium]
MHAFERFRARAAEVTHDPVAWTDLIQVVKTVVAAVVAWVVASRVFGLPQPFLAPWAALLVVHATVYRSFWTGAKQVTATVVGVLLAWATGNTLGLDPVALGVMLLAGLAVSLVPWLRDEATTTAATALIVLTTGYSQQDQMLIGRLLDTAIGVGVGLVVNALVWPLLLDLSAARAIEKVGRKLGDLLDDIAVECDDVCTEEHVEVWIRRTQDLDVEVDEAWALVRQARESGRLNPRRGSAAVRESGSLGEVLGRTEQALAEIRSLARTLGHSIIDTNQWDDEFRERWTDLLRAIAHAIQDPDSRRLGEIRAELGALAWDYSNEELSGLHWPEYGGLILNLRNIATAMDRVAASDPISSASRRPARRAAL